MERGGTGTRYGGNPALFSFPRHPARGDTRVDVDIDCCAIWCSIHTLFERVLLDMAFTPHPPYRPDYGPCVFLQPLLLYILLMGGYSATDG